ncbi:acyl-CoA dehydrogenase family protein [Aphanothece sacrum]|uniref:Acyl-CoA dehydrogenase family protein n=1 Tax=Aphanothece sacrum FPU1 TaxID=1920663 RepID=A0A401ICM1_APHSA|nr:acyl-CoA dehydrogenase family protein [Aphanothece sacrum]GBF78986.1 acyl-CoA dehydrogenase family protein [Aphanothece sacrum FPU1]GBF86666.1 acyl-CoA dehydrogenase [Aphanothece sacrum FPU3]
MSSLKENKNISQIENKNNFLEKIESYLKNFVEPVASEIDQSPDALRTALQGLINYSLLSVKIPKFWGGLELDTETFYLFQQLISRYSGALAFLQVQHQGAVSAIISSQNESLKQQYLPQIVQNKLLCGLGFSQLRRKGEPMITATPIDGGYEINGTVPWLTGFDFFDVFLLGANLDDGQEIRGIVPFSQYSDNTGSKITFSEPMKLGAMQSTNTVSATFKNWFLSSENVVSIAQAETIHENDKKVVLYPSFLILGCAKAGLDIMEKVAQTKQLDFIQEGFEHLNEEFNHCQEKIKEAIKIKFRYFEDDLQLRVWAINLAQRCTKAAVTVSSGAANYYDHPAQRVYREALVFTVFGQTTDIMKATLEQLMYN